jgi:hypothetical protein
MVSILDPFALSLSKGEREGFPHPGKSAGTTTISPFASKRLGTAVPSSRVTPHA